MKTATFPRGFRGNRAHADRYLMREIYRQSSGSVSRVNLRGFRADQTHADRHSMREIYCQSPRSVGRLNYCHKNGRFNGRTR